MIESDTPAAGREHLRRIARRALLTEGMLVRGERGLDVGDRLRVELVSTDVERRFVDFARA